MSHKYLDQVWHIRLRKITNNLSKYTVDYHSPTLSIDEKERKLTIKYKKRYKRKKMNEISRAFKKKLANLSKLQKEIEKKEKKHLIKDYYLQKISEAKREINLWKVKHFSDLPIEEKNKKIFRYHCISHPTLPEEYSEQFINEFLSFLRYVKKHKVIDTKEIENFNELLDSSFYNIKDLSLEIDFKESIERHKNFRKENQKLFEKQYSAKEVKKIFYNLIPQLNLSHEDVKPKIRDKYLFSVDRDLDILIPKNLKPNHLRLNQLIAHEIMVHVIRGYNGLKNKNALGKHLRLLSWGTSKNLQTEEGLATFFEYNIFYQSNKYDVINALDKYIRVIAVHLALHFDPFTVYEKLGKLMEAYCLIREEKVMNLRNTHLLRVYRGYSEPTIGCANPKIAHYLYGNRMIWEFVENGGNINNLFAGKIRIDQINHIKELGFHVPEEYFGSKEFPREKLLNIIKSSIDSISE